MLPILSGGYCYSDPHNQNNEVDVLSRSIQNVWQFIVCKYIRSIHITHKYVHFLSQLVIMLSIFIKLFLKI